MADGFSISARIDGLFFGAVAKIWDDKEPSAIAKMPVDGRQKIGKMGFLGDAQADLSNHGGRDKAIHHYATDHYVDWISEGHIAAGTGPAAFGENIASTGITEDDLCIGDTLRLGNAIVQVSQGRQPCWKVSAFTGNEKMAYLFQKTGRTGWYYRVLEPGYVEQGEQIELIARTQPEWTVRRVTAARLTRKVSEPDTAFLAEMPELSDDWRQDFARMAGR